MVGFIRISPMRDLILYLITYMGLNHCLVINFLTTAADGWKLTSLFAEKIIPQRLTFFYISIQSHHKVKNDSCSQTAIKMFVCLNFLTFRISEFFREGKSSLDIAREEGFDKIVALILEKVNVSCFACWALTTTPPPLIPFFV